MSSLNSSYAIDYTGESTEEFIPMLDAVEKGGTESVLRLIGDFFNPALNFETSFDKEIRKPELPEPSNETDCEALYRGLISYGVNKPIEFQSLQKWEGIVQEIKSDLFIAKLVDLSNNSPEEVAEFPFQEISDDDKVLVEEGAVFYWNIGYQISPSGQKRRTSLIRFRRLPAWRQKDLEKGIEKAKELTSLLGWD